MSKEIELKLQISINDIDKIFNLSKFEALDQKKILLKNTYFDNEAQILANHKVALRIRKKNQQYIQTLKTQGKNQGGMHIRQEYEFEIDKDELDLSLIESQLAQYLNVTNLDDLNLLPVFSTDFERTQLIIGDVELVVDYGKVSFQQLSDLICEIELELINDSQDIAQLFTLANYIAQNISVMPCDISKAARGERLKLKQQGLDFPIRFSKAYESDEKQNMQSHLQFIHANWEQWLFSGELTCISQCMQSLSAIKKIISGNTSLTARFKRSIEEINMQWQQLLNEQISVDDVVKNKKIGQVFLELSQYCYLGEINE